MARGTGQSARLRALRAEIEQSEALLRLQHGVTRCLAETGSVPAALRSVLGEICREMGWDCGRFFAVDEARGDLVFAEGWAGRRKAEREFLRASRGLRMASGEGLVGRVFRTGKPLWVADVGADARVAHPRRAQSAGIRGAVCFPVTSAAGALGVIAISARGVRKPEPRLLQAMEVVGRQLGEFLRRQRLSEQQRRFRAGMDASADMILLIDPRRMRYIDINETVCRTLGYSREEMLAMGPQDILPVAREDLQRTYLAFIADPSEMHGMNSVYRRKDGSNIPFESTRRLLRSEEGDIIVAISRDIRKRLETENALRESEARFRSLTQLSSDFFWETDAQHRLIQVEDTSDDGAGKPNSAAGKAPWEVPAVKPDAAGWAAHRARFMARKPFRNFEYALLGADGKPRYYSVSGEPRTDAEGRFAGFRGVGHEITEIVEAREHIAALAYNDALTGLANRSGFTPALEHAVRRAKRSGKRVAVLYLDLDGFKLVNDTHGHEAGDRLLVEVARRVRAALRESDQVARLGGDEFVVVLEDVPGAAQVELVAHKLITEIARPYPILPAGGACHVSASVGASLFPVDAGSPRELLQHADAAMYRAKQESKNTLRFFTVPATG